MGGGLIGGTPEQTISYKADALGRVVEGDDDLTGRVTTSVYDAFGRLIEEAAPEGTVRHEYDNVNRIVRTYTGLLDDQQDSIAADGKAITDTRYTYDELGRLETVTVVERNDEPLGANQEQTTYAYDDMGNLDTVTHFNGVVSDYDYDALNRLTSLVHTDGVGTPLASFVYELGTDGNRKSETETVSGARFDWVYDNLGRLTKETYTLDGDPTNDYSAEYIFDLASNRVRKDVDTTGDGVPDERTDYTYDDNDRLLTEIFDLDLDGADKTTTYQYGAANDRTEQTKKTVWDDVLDELDEEVEYTYNLQGRLSQVVQDSDGDGSPNRTSTYFYNDAGIRVSQTVDDNTTVETTDYVIDSRNHTGYAQVLEERNGSSGDVEKTYTLGHDVIAQQAPADAGGDTLALLSDGHGSTRGLADPTAAIVERYLYDAYGNMLPGTGLHVDPATALTSLLYSGEQTDATGLQYLRARYYNPANGRFNRLDPYAGNVQDPLSLHKYLYAHGNPVMLIDPTGEFAASIGGTLVGAGIRSGLANVSVGAVFRVPTAAYNVLSGHNLSTELWNLGTGLASDFAIGAVLGGGGSALLRFAPNAVKLRAVGQAIGNFRALRLPTSVWKHTGSVAANKIRGLLIEKTVLSRPATFLGQKIANFPVIDDYIFKGGRGIATSIKSLDLTAASYQTHSALLSRLNRLARPLQSLTTKSKAGFTVGTVSRPIDEKRLVIAFEQGAATSTQAQAITRFLREAGSKFPDVKIVIQFIP